MLEQLAQTLHGGGKVYPPCADEVERFERCTQKLLLLPGFCALFCLSFTRAHYTACWKKKQNTPTEGNAPVRVCLRKGWVVLKSNAWIKLTGLVVVAGVSE